MNMLQRSEIDGYERVIAKCMRQENDINYSTIMSYNGAPGNNLVNLCLIANIDSSLDFWS